MELIKNYWFWIVVSEAAIIIFLVYGILVLQVKRKYWKNQFAREKKKNGEYWKQISQMQGNVVSQPVSRSNQTTGHSSRAQQPRTPVQTVVPKVASDQYTYYREAVRGRFGRPYSDSAGCNFRAWQEGNMIYFEFCGAVRKALANFSATFDGVCEYSGCSRLSATTIQREAPGQMDANGNVIVKAKIRLN